jgi:type II secretory pathway pseudopilin PulG
MTKGFATIEILLAFTILALCMGSVVLITFSNQSFSVGAGTNREAMSIAETQLEEAKAASNYDFNLLNPYGGTFVSGPLSYNRNLMVTDAGLFTKQVTSTVSWLSGSNLLGLNFTALVTDSLAGLGASTCSSIVSNPEGWKQPEHHDFNLTNLAGDNLDGTGLSNVAVFNNRLYVTAITTVAKASSTFFIFDLPADPAQPPIYRSRLDNNTNSTSGLYGVVVNGNYAYVANDASTQLQVIDISNSSNPVIVGSLKILNSSTGVTLAYYKGYIFLGLAKSTGGTEFNVIDVHNPMVPVWKWGYSVGSSINQITLRGNRAYVATTNSQNIKVFDITNPTTPSYVGGYAPPDLPDANGVGSNHGESVVAVGDRVYLGRTYGPSEFYILDASSTANILPFSSKDIGSGNKTSVNGLLVRDYLAFLLTKSQLQVWNIANPTSTSPWTTDGSTNGFVSLALSGEEGVALTCEGNRLYAVLNSLGASNIPIISIINPRP